MTVCRGMMPSPLLFNLVLIQVLRNISPDVDFRVGDATVHVLAFADDVLVSSTIFGLQGNLQVLDAELHRAGLLLHPDKFCAVSLLRSRASEFLVLPSNLNSACIWLGRLGRTSCPSIPMLGQVLRLRR